MTKNLETIEDLEDFSHSLSYGLASAELPLNVTIRVDLSPDKFKKLGDELYKFTTVTSFKEFESIDFFTYLTFGIKFYIYKKSE